MDWFNYGETYMNVVFISNYFNQHQKPLCDVLFEKLGNGFRFIATSNMGDFRKKLGYKKMKEYYVKSLVDEDITLDECKTLIMDCDVLLCGVTDPNLIRDRQRSGKPILVLSERLFKDGKTHKNILRVIKYNYLHFYRKNEYLLCTSAFSASDYNKCGLFKGRAYKWGYFPQCIRYGDVDKLFLSKKHHSIIWVARIISWKHPEGVIHLANALKNEGYDFSIEMIGTGDLENDIKDKVKTLDLENYVKLTGSMSPEEVREHMEQAEIFVFTSDANEGWGAVLNEAMNSACVPVASHAIGSVPYLINNGENGLIFKSEDWYDLFIKVKSLMENERELKKIGINAYRTISEVWNANNAGDRIVKCITEWLNTGVFLPKYQNGPLSNAK